MSERPQDGDPAPDFSMPTDPDGTVTLTSLKGNPVVLYFYPKDDTPGCTTEAIDFTGLKAAFDALGATIVGVSPDPVAKHAKFRAKHDLAVILASDEDHAVAERYGVWVEKNMYGRKFMGIERSTFLIDAEGRLARVWRKVRVKGHADAVLDALKAL